LVVGITHFYPTIQTPQAFIQQNSVNVSLSAKITQLFKVIGNLTIGLVGENGFVAR
jgi:hypothetical protein